MRGDLGPQILSRRPDRPVADRPDKGGVGTTVARVAFELRDDGGGARRPVPVPCLHGSNTQTIGSGRIDQQAWYQQQKDTAQHRMNEGTR